MKRINSITGILLLLVFLFSCTDDLNRVPTNGTSSDIQYSSLDGYKQSLVTIYATLVSYSDDIDGKTNFLRNYWNMQELTTDEAVSTWDDQGILSYHIFNWTADNVASGRVYNLLMYNITLCNNYLIEASDANLSKRGITGADAEKVKEFVAEARYMRAYYYWIMMDLYANPPFATEVTLAAGDVPKQIKRADLFAYRIGIESH